MMRYKLLTSSLFFLLSNCGVPASTKLKEIGVRNSSLAALLDGFSQRAFDAYPASHGAYSVSLEPTDTTLLVGLYRDKLLHSEYFRGCGTFGGDTIFVYSTDSVAAAGFFSRMGSVLDRTLDAQAFDTYTEYYSWDGKTFHPISAVTSNRSPEGRQAPRD